MAAAVCVCVRGEEGDQLLAQKYRGGIWATHLKPQAAKGQSGAWHRMVPFPRSQLSSSTAWLRAGNTTPLLGRSVGAPGTAPWSSPGTLGRPRWQHGVAGTSVGGAHGPPGCGSPWAHSACVGPPETPNTHQTTQPVPTCTSESPTSQARGFSHPQLPAQTPGGPPCPPTYVSAQTVLLLRFPLLGFHAVICGAPVLLTGPEAL